MRIGKSQSVLDEGEGKEKRQIKSTVNKDEIQLKGLDGGRGHSIIDF